MQSNIGKNVNTWKLSTLKFTFGCWKKILRISVKNFQIGDMAIPFPNHNFLMKEIKIYPCPQICK